MLCASPENVAEHVHAGRFGLPEPCVLYVFDAYCGWCWGASPLVQELASALTQQRVPVFVISGGLFVGTRAARIDAYPHIANANQRITGLTGVRFGDRYGNLLRDGSLVLDSQDPAIAFSALRAQAPSRAVDLSHRLQEVFYLHGRSLSDPETAIDIARQEGLDAEQVREDMCSGVAREMASNDFDMARSLGINSYPTLLAMRSGRVTQVPCFGASTSTIKAVVEWLVCDPTFAQTQRAT